MRGQIYCMMWSGFLDSNVHNTLFLAAREMVRDHREKQMIRNEWCEGLVRTKFTPALIGAVSGIIFDAEVETERGKSTVKYLVRTADLDEDIGELEWTFGGGNMHPADFAHQN